METPYQIFRNQFLLVTEKNYKCLNSSFTTEKYIEFLKRYANFSYKYFCRLHNERKFEIWIQRYFLPRSATKFFRHSIDIYGFGQKKNCWKKKK